MNSPPDPGSPSLSTESSGSPPPEEINFSLDAPNQEQSSQGYLARLASMTPGISRTSEATSGASKRRLPTGGSFGAGGSARDAKTRRRGDSSGTGRTANWEGGVTREPSGGARKEKDDLIDSGLVELLRKGAFIKL
ncbi:hypothetical protein CVT24_009357 [Panaeolus cyanescens]|uniref:Uncharacterized protein n=1 Tax=Panaeolus cyanescens TaxID=181874 RepID=A0A409Y7Z4_9AGAR|nr:hypothetical protein CVT24_009357 [Panaeolus cyanescens]